MKRLFLSVLMIVCLSVPIPVHAMTADYAGRILEAMIEDLVENYATEKLTVEELYAAAARGIAAELDEYTEFLTVQQYREMYSAYAGNYKGIGIQYRNLLDGNVEVTKVFDGSPAKTAGVMVGDIILDVNNTTVNAYSGETLAQIVAWEESTIVMRISRGGTIGTFRMEKSEIRMNTVEYGQLSEFLPNAADAQTGYILCTQIGERTATEMRIAVNSLRTRGITKVVLDFRGNPGGFKNVIDEISRMFVPRGVVYSMIDAAGNKTDFQSNLAIRPFNDIVILVDEHSASASELFAAAMQDASAATIIGQTTYGKGLIQDFKRFPTNDRMKYTVMEYLRRSGEKLHGIGVIPDIIIEHPHTVGSELLYLSNDGTVDGIKNLNAVLAAIGYDVDLSVTRYDDRTRAAISDIQQRAKLNPTGYCDRQTLLAINIAYSLYLNENDPELNAAYEFLTKG